MKVKPGSLLVAVAVVTSFVVACTSDNPNRPTMSFTAPLAQQPANGVTYNFNQQPITLTIANVVRTGSETVTYSVEVARDAAFANKVFTRDGIAENPSGTTSVTLDPLAGNSNYYWRWKAVVNGIAGEPSNSQGFFLKPNIVLNAPQLVSPSSGTTTTTVRPAFTVVNSTFEGQPGAITYQFQVSTSSTFSPVLVDQSVAQTGGAGQTTSFTPGVDLPVGTLYWRARARDLANSVDSPFANGANFERKAGIDLNSVVWQLGANIANWPETVTITSAVHSGDTLCVDSVGETWPSIPFPFDPSVDIYGNQYNFVQIGGVWYGGAGHYLKVGQNCKGEMDEFYFTQGFQGVQPISSVVLHTGDIFGVALSTPGRTYPVGKTLDHRSNVVLIPW